MPVVKTESTPTAAIESTRRVMMISIRVKPCDCGLRSIMPLPPNFFVFRTMPFLNFSPSYLLNFYQFTAPVWINTVTLLVRSLFTSAIMPADVLEQTPSAPLQLNGLPRESYSRQLIDGKGTVIPV